MLRIGRGRNQFFKNARDGQNHEMERRASNRQQRSGESLKRAHHIISCEDGCLEFYNCRCWGLKQKGSRLLISGKKIPPVF